MVPVSWTEMQCPDTYIKEYRKVAKVIPDHLATAPWSLVIVSALWSSTMWSLIHDFYNNSVVMFLSFSHDLIAMYLENKHFLNLCYLFLLRVYIETEERRKREGLSSFKRWFSLEFHNFCNDSYYSESQIYIAGVLYYVVFNQHI